MQTSIAYRVTPSQMNQKREPSSFAVYRLTITGSSFFMSNHLTEDAAKQCAACLQVCAQAGISYVVDPPHGALSLSEPKAGIRAFVARMFSGASDVAEDGASSRRVLEEAHRSPVYLSQNYWQWRVLGKTRTGRDSWRLLQWLMTEEQATDWARANGKQVKKEPNSAETRTRSDELFVGSGQAIPSERLPRKSRTRT